MYFLFPNFLFLTQTNMQKLKEYFAVRAVRLGVLAVLVATFVGLPSLKYYTGTHAFDKLDVVNMAASVFLAQDMPPADGGYMPPADGGYMPPADGGYMPPADCGYMPPADGGYMPPADGGYMPPAD